MEKELLNVTMKIVSKYDWKTATLHYMTVLDKLCCSVQHVVTISACQLKCPFLRSREQNKVYVSKT